MDGPEIDDYGIGRCCVAMTKLESELQACQDSYGEGRVRRDPTRTAARSRYYS